MQFICMQSSSVVYTKLMLTILQFDILTIDVGALNSIATLVVYNINGPGFSECIITD